MMERMGVVGTLMVTMMVLMTLVARSLWRLCEQFSALKKKRNVFFSLKFWREAIFFLLLFRSG
jgi:hypothetical protein